MHIWNPDKNSWIRISQYEVQQHFLTLVTFFGHEYYKIIQILNNLHAFNTDRQFCTVYMQLNSNLLPSTEHILQFSPTDVYKKCLATYWVFVRNIWSKNLTNHFFREYNILISGIPHVNVYKILYNGSKIMQTK